MSVALVMRTRARSLVHACALLAPLALPLLVPALVRAEGGQAAGWGENFFLETGAGWKSAVEEEPVPVAGVNAIVQLASGDSFTLARMGDGTVDSWGGNMYRQLGDGTRRNLWEKQQPHAVVAGLSQVREVAAGGAHAMALLDNGEVRVWGSNQFGQLGNGVLNPLNPALGTYTMVGTEQPLAIPVSWTDTTGIRHTLGHVSRIVAGASSDYAIIDGGKEVLAWGRNRSEELGLGTDAGVETCITEIGPQRCSTYPRPVDLPEAVKDGGATVTEMTAGNGFAVLVLSDGTVWSFGSNGKGELGTNAVTTAGTVAEHERDYPVRVENISQPLQVAAGAEHTLAILAGGEVVGWGANGSGQLGRPTTEECQATRCFKTPQPISWRDRLGHAQILTGISDVSAGQSYSLALGAGEGTVYSFGSNSYGTLGRRSACNLPKLESCEIPTPVPGLGRVAGVDAGMKHAQALLAPGVQAPAPPVSVTAGAGSLGVQWSTLTEGSPSEYRLGVSAFSSATPYSYAWTPSIRLTSVALTTLSHLYSPLAAAGYIISVRSCIPACEPASLITYQKLRLVPATPLP